MLPGQVFKNLDGLVKGPFSVSPAKAGVQKVLLLLNSAKASLRARRSSE